MRQSLTTLLLTALLSAVALLSACGQKGPLYLPQDQSQAEPTDETHGEATEASGKR